MLQVRFCTKDADLEETIEEVTRLHVGCGPHNILPGWCNVDLRHFKGIDRVMDVTEEWPWVGSLQYVYGEHFLEHLSLEKGLKFLQHASCALRVGGKIRLSTPSLEWVIKTRFTFDEFGDSHRLEQTWLINKAFHGWGHQFLYSKSMLTAVLKAIGLSKISFHEYGESNDSALCGLERHGGWKVEAGYPTVWVVEACKGTNELFIDHEFIQQAEAMHMKYVRATH